MSNEADQLPIIAAMIGDPGGIGPEVCVKAIASGELRRLCRPLLVGSAEALKRAAGISSLNIAFRVAPDIKNARFDSGGGAGGETVIVIDPGDLRPDDFAAGQPSAASGRAVMNWIRLVDGMAASGLIGGCVMGPVDSASLKMAGAVENIDDLQPSGSYLFRISGALRVVPLTEHLRIRDVPDTVTREAVLKLVRLVDETLRRWGVASPRIGVAGLNPHAMYEEDSERIAPAVNEARRLGIACSGPISPDSIFRQGLEGRFDAIISMYHDQGQIALKSAAFEGACTIYLGPPYVRVTAPHGSAMDIAGTGRANHRSILAAMKTAAALAGGRGFL
ncbi:MAG: PdxA family dehydrogenase [Candidatus Binataceae bacterium]